MVLQKETIFPGRRKNVPLIYSISNFLQSIFELGLNFLNRGLLVKKGRRKIRLENW